jgi:hypothetical protein
MEGADARLRAVTTGLSGCRNLNLRAGRKKHFDSAERGGYSLGIQASKVPAAGQKEQKRRNPMPTPTDIYVALRDAPEGLEDSFEVAKPARSIRTATHLRMFFEVPPNSSDGAVIRGEVARKLEGQFYFYVELDGQTPLFYAGDHHYCPMYAAEPDPEDCWEPGEPLTFELQKWQ